VPLPTDRSNTVYYNIILWKCHHVFPMSLGCLKPELFKDELSKQF